ncbi:MAG TPA: Hsp70 family protein, partial [candidate division Zixibacteria bacterium]|nr:Hsp70 family protein [candidate division Zixibacteria bacterium]
FTKLIERNTTIPTRKSEIFSTADENQTSVEIHVLQGERQMASDNKSIGRFMLDGIPPAPRGVPQIEVTFDIDANGILNVSAKDKATGRQQQIKIQPSSGLNESEIRRMVDEAKSNEVEDQKRREEVELRNRADQLAYQTEKTLKEQGDKISTDTKKDVEEAAAEVREALKSGDMGRVRSTYEKLTAAWHKASEELYKQTAGTSQPGGGSQEPPGSGPSSGSGKSDKGPVDADFEVVK